MALVAAFPAGAQVPAPPKTPTAEGWGGSAASVDPLATQTAIDVLRYGGNAVDAAVAAAGVLGVVEPFSCGIGGGGFMVIYDAQRHKVDTIDSREAAPAGLTKTSFEPYQATQPVHRGLRERAERRRARHRGRLGEGAQALRLPLAALAAPARPADRPRGLRRRPDLQRAGRPATRTSSTTSPRRGTSTSPGGDRRRRSARSSATPTWRETYRRIGNDPDRFYRGGDRARHRADRAAPAGGAGLRPPARRAPRLDDPARTSRATTRSAASPTKIDYRGLDVYGMGPPSSGGTTVGEALNILEGFPIVPACPASRRCTATSRRPSSPTPTATRTSPTRPSSTCRCAGCSPTRFAARAAAR